jgi:uncharacterized membrane protein required for colicin V production
VVTLQFIFWMLVIIFAIIGAMRGWAKELLVTFSVILALFILNVLGRYVGPVREIFAPTASSAAAFWIRSTILIILVFFGYQTPNFPRIAGPRFARERLSDVLLGLVIGALNGYLIWGTLWYFMDAANYPFPKYVTPPPGDLAILGYLPPHWLGIPQIYFAMAVAFIFVLVVLL